MLKNPFGPKPSQAFTNIQRSAGEVDRLLQPMFVQAQTAGQTAISMPVSMPSIESFNIPPLEQSVNRSGGGTVTSSGYGPVDEYGYKVRLHAVRGFPSRDDTVVFDVTPILSESRSVEYTGTSPVHMPGSIQIYKKTNARTFSLTAKFVSRNQEQATKNIKNLQLLRGWTMPYFGIRSQFTTPTGQASTGDSPMTIGGDDRSSMLGAPPDVLYLFAYSSSTGAGSDRTGTGGQVNIKKLPVVITSLNISYPEDVDYIPVKDTGEPFPVRMEVTMELAETHSPKGYENFSLEMFKRGQLVQF